MNISFRQSDFQDYMDSVNTPKFIGQPQIELKRNPDTNVVSLTRSTISHDLGLDENLGMSVRNAVIAMLKDKQYLRRQLRDIEDLEKDILAAVQSVYPEIKHIQVRAKSPTQYTARLER